MVKSPHDHFDKGCVLPRIKSLGSLHVWKIEHRKGKSQKTNVKDIFFTLEVAKLLSLQLDRLLRQHPDDHDAGHNSETSGPNNTNEDAKRKKKNVFKGSLH